MVTDYLTLEETSKITDENVETLRKRCQAGSILGAQNKGKTWLIPQSYVFKVKVEKTSIPLLWLDTWAIIHLTKAVKTNLVSYEEKAWGEMIFEKITSLTDRKKILCPEADQGIEIETGQRLVKEARELQAQISRGITTHYYHSVEELQIQRVMKAYVDRESEVTLPWDDLLFDDPDEELDKKSPYIISVHGNPPKKELEERKRTNRSIATDWEALRVESNQKKENFNKRLQLELAARGNLIMKTAALLMAKKIHKKQITTDDLIRAMNIMGRPLSWWERDRKQAEDFFGLIKFYLSEEFKKIPAIDVSCSLVSNLVTDHEKIRPSDVMDVNQISAILPYSHYMVLDGPMRDKVTYKLKLDKKYDTQILRLKELPTLLDKLEKN